MPGDHPALPPGSGPDEPDDPDAQGMPPWIRRDFVVVGTLFATLVALSLTVGPGRRLVREAVTGGHWWIGEVLFVLAASHLAMMVFGARRSRDLKRELAGRRVAQARLRHQADHDALTDLRNRASWVRELDRALAAGAPSAVVLVDLDRFKEINDTLGHPVGDRLLQALARRMAASLPRDAVLARLGGDEFAVLVPGAPRATADGVAAALLEAIREPVEVDGLSLEVDASLGLAVAPDDGTSPSLLLRRADVAMYSAKTQSLGVVAFSAALGEQDRARLGVHGDLKRAVAARQLHLVYQPKAAMDDGRVVGVEALVRWLHPSRGLLGPDAFLAVAEQTGLIRPLTDLVLDDELRACRRWRDQGLKVPVAVNLSARSLLDQGLPGRVATLLARHELEASCLELEVTESAAMANPVQSVQVLRRLAELGVTLSVDDFGTGHTSLSYLSRLPIGALKIDQSFVRRLADNQADRTIVRTTIGLAHDLGLTVVAEGLENATAWPTLSAWGCDEAQGFWLSRPVPEDDVPACVHDLPQRLKAHLTVPRPRRRASG